MNNKNSIENGNGKSEKHHEETILSYMCPTCKQLLGKKEFEKVTDDFRKIKEEESIKSQVKINELQSEIRELKDDIETRANEIASHKVDVEVKKERQTNEKTRNKELEDMRIQTEQNVKQYYDEQLRNKEKEKVDQRKMFEHFKENYEHEIDKQYKDKFSRLTDIITEKETQIKRANEELEVARKKLTKNQSELTGEVGEINLYNRLTEAFQQEQDYFERNKRGTAMGDIIHYLKTPNGILDTKIVYDNKSSSTVTRSDIEKAQRYKKIHNTNHVIIVSSNLPKRDIENGFIGQKEGITLVHPDIVIPIVKLIRQEIIKIEKYAKSKIEKESKETELYDFITSDNFLGLLEENQFVYDHLIEDQEKEEKEHQTRWKKKKSEYMKLKENMSLIRHKIDMITTYSS